MGRAQGQAQVGARLTALEAQAPAALWPWLRAASAIGCAQQLSRWWD